MIRESVLLFWAILYTEALLYINCRYINWNIIIIIIIIIIYYSDKPPPFL